MRLLEGRTDQERLLAVEEILQRKGVPFERRPYLVSGEERQNLLWEVHPGHEILILSAHYDAARGSPGANDNASCVSVLLEAGERLAREHLGPLGLRILFFGDEEGGLLGSQAYVAGEDLREVIGVLNLELCGIGDMAGLWDVRNDDRGSLLFRSLVAAFEREDIPFGVVPRLRRFSSDHRSFWRRGIPGFALTVVPEKEEALLRAYVEDPGAERWRDPSSRPTPFQTYHSAGDLADTLSEGALRLMAGAVVEGVLELSRKLRPTSPDGEASIEDFYKTEVSLVE